MNATQTEAIEKLRKMESAEAVDWLLKHHPKEGCFYISKRTWRKQDQLRLAEHFLSSVPHASAVCYESLLSVMALPKFVGVLKKYIPQNAADKELLEYYLYPTLDKYAKNDNDRLAIAAIRGALK